MSFRAAGLGFGLPMLLLAPMPALASVIEVVSVAASTEFQARIRWGGAGFEAAILDPRASTGDVSLNPAGAPVWRTGQAYAWEVAYAVATGAATLKVDFDRNGRFGDGEVLTRALFAGTSVSYAGRSFETISISGNESGSTARSSLGDLRINGDREAAIRPSGGFAEAFYQPGASGTFGDVSISGVLTFANSATSQERPTWNISFRGPVHASRSAAATAVAEPAALALFGAGLLGLILARRRRAA